MHGDNSEHVSSPTTTTSRFGGRPGETAAHHAERRQVTALFCDLVESVSLATSLDPEDMMRVIDVYLAACDDIVSAHGGNVMQYMGDGVLAYFGYPRANEDDAANAVRSGIGIRDAAARLDLPPGIVLRTRIGIATGLVVVSDVVGHREARGGGIVGETPNLAARLQSIAQPDCVVIAATTKRVSGGQFTYRDLGTLPLKGFPAPVPAFEVVEALTDGSRFNARTRGTANPLVGRDRQLARIFEYWAQARGGRGKTVLLQGEPGIGKSRLVEELRHHVDVTPHVHLAWYCGPTTSDSALSPAVQQLTRAAGFARGEGAEAHGVRLDALLTRLGVDEPTGRAVIADLLGRPPATGSAAAKLTPDRRKAVTLETLLAMIERAANGGPALFVCEDLHWCDSTTLELLYRVIALAADRPWLVLLTARPEFRPDWPPDQDIETIELDRLDPRDAEQICRHLGATGLLPAEMVRQIVARCDGVPLFVEEMTKSVLEAMADVPASDRNLAVAIPASVRDSLAARLDRLGLARRTACLGAAIGRRFGYELLAAVAALPESALRKDLRELARSGLIDRSGVPPASTYLFRHALIRDAAYDSLLKSERETLHGLIATVLRDRFPETWRAEPELLAYHFTESGAIAEAIPLWAQSGQRAAGRAAHLEAVEHFQTALNLTRRQAASAARAEIELRLLIGLSTSLSATRGFAAPEVGAVLAEARAVCDALGDIPGALFAILRGMASIEANRGDLTAAEESARRMMTIGAQTGLPEHRIEAESCLGYILYLKGDDMLAALRCLERMETLHSELDGARLSHSGYYNSLALGLGALSFVLQAIGDDAGARRVARKLNDHARSLDQPFTLMFALARLWQFEVQNENYAGALEKANEIATINDAHGSAHYEMRAPLFKAICAGHLGSAHDALEEVTACIYRMNRFGMIVSRARILGELAWLQAATGNLPTALSTIGTALACALDTGENHILSVLYRRRAEILVRMPGADPAEVSGSLREAIAIAESQGALGFARPAAALLARLAPASVSDPTHVIDERQVAVPADTIP